MQIVPQYIDVEDKVAGPLTWKHIGWIFVGGVFTFVAWATLDHITFVIIAIPIVLLTAAMAFYRPNGVSMVEFIGYGFGFIFRPKRYTWKQEVEKIKEKNKEPIKIASSSREKKLTADDIAALAQTLDSHGVGRSERIKELMKENMKKNNE